MTHLRWTTAGESHGPALIGVLLTGANSDGAAGMQTIKANSGYTIVQDPESAEAQQMPEAALGLCEIDQVLAVEEIAPALVRLARR